MFSFLRSCAKKLQDAHTPKKSLLSERFCWGAVYTPRGLHFVLILGLISFAFLSDWGPYNGEDRGDASIGLMMSEQGEEISTPFVPRKLYSVFSTDLQDMKYASLAPLSAYVWKHHLGVTPIVYISYHSSQLSHVGQLLADAIEMHGGEVRIMPRRPGDLIPTTLQNVRFAAM